MDAITPKHITADEHSHVVKPADMEWKPTRFAGCEVKTLLMDEKTGLMTALMRFAPGAVLPDHEHVNIEQTYVLEGRLVDKEGPVERLAQRLGQVARVDAGAQRLGRLDPPVDQAALRGAAQDLDQLAQHLRGIGAGRGAVGLDAGPGQFAVDVAAHGAGDLVEAIRCRGGTGGPQAVGVGRAGLVPDPQPQQQRVGGEDVRDLGAPSDADARRHRRGRCGPCCVGRRDAHVSHDAAPTGVA